VAAVATETFSPDRLILSMQYGSELYRDQVAAALSALPCVPIEEAEHLVAVSGEDERAYGLRDRTAFLDALFARCDEFLADDDGGFHQMRIHVTSHPRTRAALEFWFHVATPNTPERGVWFRHLVVRLGETQVYAALGPACIPQ
jgi:hypothetical protein